MIMSPIDVPISDTNDATVTLLLVIDKETILIPNNSRTVMYLPIYLLIFDLSSILPMKQSCISITFPIMNYCKLLRLFEFSSSF